MSRFSACNLPTCAIVVEGKASACPKCGGPMRSVGESPVRGIILLLCGLFLVAIMGLAAHYVVPLMLHPGEEVDGSSFSGTAGQAQMILGLFALVFLFGITASANGVYQIVTRRQSRVFVAVTLGLAALLLVAAIVARKALS